MNDQLSAYCREVIAEFDLIPDTRKSLLKKLSEYIRTKRLNNLPVHLVYICTHNSRRSHFGQVWAHVAAAYFDVQNVRTYSGGTEATAFHPNAIAALRRAGFLVVEQQAGSNPVYAVFHDEAEMPSICYSKVYTDERNPSTGFAAIMTCSDAEENCPFIPGVELRIGTTYDDPKAFDHTPQQNEKYDERCRQIARESLFVFANIG